MTKRQSKRGSKTPRKGNRYVSRDTATDVAQRKWMDEENAKRLDELKRIQVKTFVRGAAYGFAAGVVVSLGSVCAVML